MALVGIVAGGIGSRMGADMPKQFLDLCGEPVIIHTIKRFVSHKSVESIIVGVNPNWYDYMKDLIGSNFDGKVYLTTGGQDRNDTITNIIEFAKKNLGAEDNEILITHDAVRPFVSHKMIDDSISAMEYCDICTAAVPATDTVIFSNDGRIASDFPLRKNIFMVQTPQTFRLGNFTDMLKAVTEEEKREVTDACRLFHMNGRRVYMIDGDGTNIKLTYPNDFETAKTILLHNA